MTPAAALPVPRALASPPPWQSRGTEAALGQGADLGGNPRCWGRPLQTQVRAWHVARAPPAPPGAAGGGSGHSPAHPALVEGPGAAQGPQCFLLPPREVDEQESQPLLSLGLVQPQEVGTAGVRTFHSHPGRWSPRDLTRVPKTPEDLGPREMSHATTRGRPPPIGHCQAPRPEPQEGGLSSQNFRGLRGCCSETPLGRGRAGTVPALNLRGGMSRRSQAPTSPALPPSRHPPWPLTSTMPLSLKSPELRGLAHPKEGPLQEVGRARAQAGPGMCQLCCPEVSCLHPSQPLCRGHHC